VIKIRCGLLSSTKGASISGRGATTQYILSLGLDRFVSICDGLRRKIRESVRPLFEPLIGCGYHALSRTACHSALVRAGLFADPAEYLAKVASSFFAGLTPLYWARVIERRTIVSFCAVERKHLSCPVSARTRKYDQSPARSLFPTRRNIRLRGVRTNLPKRTLAEWYGERNNYAKIKGCLVSHVPGSRRVFMTILARGGF
jgi:hypothetical protein